MKHTQMWVKAQQVVDAVDCRRCGRPGGQQCRNLSLASWREPKDKPLPHDERYEDAGVKR